LSMFIDSHAHLEMDDFDRDREEVLRRALEARLTHIITIGTDLESSLKALELTEKYDFIFAAVGCHPHNAKDLDSRLLDTLVSLASNRKVVAWGEIGLDFFRRHSPPHQQVEAFEQQLDAAARLGLPVIIHSREASLKVYDIIKKRRENHGGVIHCFAETYELAMAFVEMGYLISIPGTVTYKNAATVQDVAKRVPLESLIIETDAPFLAPVPFRGKRNEPAYVVHTANRIAELRQIKVEELAHHASDNTKRVFRINDGLPGHR
jgi:TatD DNase family protein